MAGQKVDLREDEPSGSLHCEEAVPLIVKLNPGPIAQALIPHSPSTQSTSHQPFFQINDEQFRLLQLNVNGIKNKQIELASYLFDQDITVAAIQETKLRPGQKDPKLSGYTIIRQDRPDGNGGGLLLAVRTSVSFRKVALPTAAHHQLEQQAIEIHLGVGHVTIINVYLPTYSACPTGHPLIINHLAIYRDPSSLGISMLTMSSGICPSLTKEERN